MRLRSQGHDIDKRWSDDSADVVGINCTHLHSRGGWRWLQIFASRAPAILIIERKISPKTRDDGTPERKFESSRIFSYHKCHRINRFYFNYKDIPHNIPILFSIIQMCKFPNGSFVPPCPNMIFDVNLREAVKKAQNSDTCFQFPPSLRSWHHRSAGATAVGRMNTVRRELVGVLRVLVDRGGRVPCCADTIELIGTDRRCRNA
jgi:hypothetical protein